VRSLTVQAPRAAVEAALGGWSRLAPGLWAMGGRRLGVRAKTAAATTLHLLSDADPVAESRWAEAFRAAIEAAP
jgi:hypothetical protein